MHVRSRLKRYWVKVGAFDRAEVWAVFRRVGHMCKEIRKADERLFALQAEERPARVALYGDHVALRPLLDRVRSIVAANRLEILFSLSDLRAAQVEAEFYHLVS